MLLDVERLQLGRVKLHLPVGSNPAPPLVALSGDAAILWVLPPGEGRPGGARCAAPMPSGLVVAVSLLSVTMCL